MGISRRLRLRALAAVATLVATGAAFAHHSFAMFDRDKEVVLSGTIHEFQWTNPHAFIEFDVANGKGEVERWSVEMNSPNNLTRQGWKSTFLKGGDKVTVTLNPLRDGKHGGLFVAIVLADGKVIKDPTSRQRPPPAEGAPKS
ncbi:MAG: DUF6152 family protein [Gammaproteobacteria bacterium]